MSGKQEKNPKAGLRIRTSFSGVDIKLITGLKKKKRGFLKSPISFRSPRALPREKWAHDEEFIKCALCVTDFSLFNRRHHCRFCGLVFCAVCSDCEIKGERTCRLCALKKVKREFANTKIKIKSVTLPPSPSMSLRPLPSLENSIDPESEDFLLLNGGGFEGPPVVDLDAVAEVTNGVNGVNEEEARAASLTPPRAFRRRASTVTGTATTRAAKSSSPQRDKENLRHHSPSLTPAKADQVPKSPNTTRGLSVRRSLGNHRQPYRPKLSRTRAKA